MPPRSIITPVSSSVAEMPENLVLTLQSIEFNPLRINVRAATRAVAAQLQIGAIMPGQINVDTTNETVTLQFADDHGDPTDAPAGVQVAYSSSDTSVATVATDAGNPLQGDITPVAVGTSDISVEITGATEPNGNPFTADPVTVTVSAGPAAEASLVLSV